MLLTVCRVSLVEKKLVLWCLSPPSSPTVTSGLLLGRSEISVEELETLSAGTSEVLGITLPVTWRREATLL